MEKVKSDNRILFTAGAIAGALIFIIIYGIGVLDCNNDGWLFHTERDLAQHYIGWCHYRNSVWQFPLGLIETLSYPRAMSVIYTDSIPLFAVVFKLFGAYLPTHFQYFGLYGILSFALSGGTAAVLMRRFIGNPIAAFISSLFLTVSFPILQRMYYHTALASHWIIFLCLILYVYHDIDDKFYKRVICWGSVGFLCVAIHSYFLPIAGMIMAADLVTDFLKRYYGTDNNGLPAKSYAARIIAGEVLVLISFCATALLNLYLLGGFYGDADAYGPGLGSFGSNLNTFINPIDMGRLMPRLPLFYDFQYEGFGYVGAGILFLFAVCALLLIFAKWSKNEKVPVHSNRIYGRVGAGLFVVSWMAATLPLLSFNDVKIIWIPYIRPIERILGIFRSNGRFIWVAMYILMIFALALVSHVLEKQRWPLVALLAVALAIQITDESSMVLSKREYFIPRHEYASVWEQDELKEQIQDKECFVYLYNDNDITLDSAYYCYLSGMYQNNFYFARDVDEAVNTDITMYEAELANGVIRDNAVYVLKKEQYEADRQFWEALDVRTFEIDEEHMGFTKVSENR